MKVLKTLAGLACGLAVAGAAFAADPVKIGLILPMSGPFAAYGKQIEHGVKLYLAQHGDTYGGRKVELILKDDNPGTSGDVVGTAQGQASGNAFRRAYTLRLPVDGSVYEVQFDDWMYLVDERVMLNKAVMSKFGIRLGEVTLAFTKNP